MLTSAGLPDKLHEGCVRDHHQKGMVIHEKGMVIHQ
jgi:hypothetical protein